MADEAFLKKLRAKFQSDPEALLEDYKEREKLFKTGQTHLQPIRPEPAKSVEAVDDPAEAADEPDDEPSPLAQPVVDKPPPCFLCWYESKGGDIAGMRYPYQGQKRFYGRKCLQCRGYKTRIILNANGTGLWQCMDRGCGWSAKGISGLIGKFDNCPDCKWKRFAKILPRLKLDWKELNALVLETKPKERYVAHFTSMAWWIYTISKQHQWGAVSFNKQIKAELGIKRSIQEAFDRWWDPVQWTYKRTTGGWKDRSQYQYNFDELKKAVARLRKRTTTTETTRAQSRRRSS